MKDYQYIGQIKLYRRWGFLECDHQLGRYLRNLYYLNTYKCVKLQRPSNGEHITIVSPDDEICLDKFNYDGLYLGFNLSLELFTNGNAYWVPVISRDIEKFRINLGLKPDKDISIHFCIGYIKEK